MNSSPQWPQDVAMKAMEEIATNPCPKERKGRPHKEQASNCPRCNSSNTKFCYYNNYSLSQPRFFCKTCRRYWTEGGSLRNIPVGGGSRKNKRSLSVNNPSRINDDSPVNPPNPRVLIHQNPNTKIIHDQVITQDLNLGFASSIPSHDFKAINDLIQVPNFKEMCNINNNNTSSSNNPSSSTSTSSSHQISALELLNGFTASKAASSCFTPMPIMDPSTVMYSPAGFSLPEFKPSLGFSLDGLAGGGYDGFRGVQETSGKLLFPYEDLNKQVASSDSNEGEPARDHRIGDGAAGYWNGMVGGGGSW